MHGDTATTLAATLAAYYQQMPVVRVEAGMRNHNLNSPWPKEANGKLVGGLATLNFAPTQDTGDNLLAQSVNQSSIEITSNTVIDALYITVERVKNEGNHAEFAAQFSMLRDGMRLLRVIGHRRQSFGGGFEIIRNALARIATVLPSSTSFIRCISIPMCKSPLIGCRKTFPTPI